jgi:ABC-type nickel/cobalt efflux system permease component RcnA
VPVVRNVVEIGGARTARHVWWMFVVAGLRSKFGALVFVLMVATTVYLFVRGRAGSGAFMLGLTLFIYARVPAAIGAYIGVRKYRHEDEGG